MNVYDDANSSLLDWRAAEAATGLTDEELLAFIGLSISDPSFSPTTFQGPLSRVREQIEAGRAAVEKALAKCRKSICERKIQLEGLDPAKRLETVTGIVGQALADMTQNQAITATLIAASILRIGLDQLCLDAAPATSG